MSNLENLEEEAIKLTHRVREERVLALRTVRRPAPGEGRADRRRDGGGRDNSRFLEIFEQLRSELVNDERDVGLKLAAELAQVVQLLLVPGQDRQEEWSKGPVSVLVKLCDGRPGEEGR